MRQQLIEASKEHFLSHISKHRMNVEVMLNNPTAIAEHSDIMEAIEREVAKMAEYQDKLEIIERYFSA
jgi:hypothetical protein